MKKRWIVILITCFIAISVLFYYFVKEYIIKDSVLLSYRFANEDIMLAAIMDKPFAIMELSLIFFGIQKLSLDQPKKTIFF